MLFRLRASEPGVLAMFGDIFGCQNWGSATGIPGGNQGGCSPHSAQDIPATVNDPAPNVYSAEGDTP